MRLEGFKIEYDCKNTCYSHHKILTTILTSIRLPFFFPITKYYKLIFSILAIRLVLAMKTLRLFLTS